ncbi:hypothetical protein Vadar_006557 [Vaccinium darrowii]|uniref:Uncharacterized protein n=1 Tax=Vaccinium darrowii TaxID=229202 RepID=A0ACB7XNM8_9ERIC|nr:hypothetical protein Vadar_006557 [Vaccinium darrowii]
MVEVVKFFALFKILASTNLPSPAESPNVLKAIADNSFGGTFSDVQNEDNLSIAFSQCLGGLLGVVVQDLKLTVTKKESTIEKVTAENYPQSRDDTAGSVTISFGNLYIKELHKVILDLDLPGVSSWVLADVLEINYTYSAGGVKPFEANPLLACLANITCIWTSVEPEREEVMVQVNLVRTAQMKKIARVMGRRMTNSDVVEPCMVASGPGMISSQQGRDVDVWENCTWGGLSPKLERFKVKTLDLRGVVVKGKEEDSLRN